MFSKTFLTLALIFTVVTVTSVLAAEDARLAEVRQRIQNDLNGDYSVPNLRPAVQKKVASMLSQASEDIKVLMNFKEGDEEFFGVQPSLSVTEIVQKLTPSIEEELKGFQRDMPTIKEELERKYAFFKIGDKVSIETKSKGLVTGRLVSISNNHITVGTKFISIVDMPEEVQARVYKDKHVVFIKDMLEKECQKDALAYASKTDDLLKERLPRELLKAGYLPYPFGNVFNFKQGKIENWGSREQVLQFCIAEERNGYAKSMMDKEGYTFVQGRGWITKEEYKILQKKYEEKAEREEMRKQQELQRQMTGQGYNQLDEQQRQGYVR